MMFNDNHHHHHKASIGSLVEVVNEMTIIRMNMMEMVVIVTTFILKDNDAGHWSMTKQDKRLKSVRVMMTQKILIMLFCTKVHLIIFIVMTDHSQDAEGQHSCQCHQEV